MKESAESTLVQEKNTPLSPAQLFHRKRPPNHRFEDRTVDNFLNSSLASGGATAYS